MKRTSEIKRKTAETDIELSLSLDGAGVSDISTGIGFLDHMLTLFARHGNFDLKVKCAGDTQVDFHHTVEDIGICLGKALTEALGDMAGITRYADVILPMDVSYIYTLGGYGTGAMVEEPRVLGAVSDITLRQELEEKGVTFSPGEPAAGIVGASAVLVAFGQMYGIPAACLMGETSGYIVDHKSAVALVRVLESIFGLDLDLKELTDRSQQIDELTAKVKEISAAQEGPGDLGYIG